MTSDAVKMAIEALRPFKLLAELARGSEPGASEMINVNIIRKCADALSALEQAVEPVDVALLDRAELAWQRFFYPAADCFTGPAADKLPAIDLEVADCLRLVLAAVGRLVVTPEADVPAPLPTLQRLGQEFDAGEGLARRVAETMDEDGGCWSACSGCQEGVDGYVSTRDYPYSPIFKCQPGSGCRECGGIGVTWMDGAFLAGYGDALSDPPQSRGQAFDGEGEGSIVDRARAIIVHAIRECRESSEYLTAMADKVEKAEPAMVDSWLVLDAVIAALKSDKAGGLWYRRWIAAQKEIAALSSAKRGEG